MNRLRDYSEFLDLGEDMYNRDCRKVVRNMHRTIKDKNGTVVVVEREEIEFS